VSEIVLVHGIAQEQETADTLEARWLPALAGGIRLAGEPSLADHLWRDRRPGRIEARMAFYGDLFLGKGYQGSDTSESPTYQGGDVSERLAREWLDRAAARSTRTEDRRIARGELATVVGDTRQQQGPREGARRFVAGAARIRWFARSGFAAASLVNRSLRQVSAYLTAGSFRDAVQTRVTDLVDDQTRIIVAHSLGAIVAFEVCHQLDRSLPVLVTLGNPLGLRTVVFERVQPQPPTYPPYVRHWANIADKDDVVAAEPDLGPLFNSSVPLGCRLDGCWTVENGAQPHSASFYLGKRSVGQLVVEAFS
jgi:hypothetical protein